MAGEVEGLEIEIAANLRKVQANMLQIEARMVRAAKKAEESFAQANTQVERTGATLARSTSAGGRGMANFGSIAQQAGFQVGDFATQVASGQSAMVAFAQQAPQFLGIFGAFGAIAGAAVAVGGALAIAFSRAAGEAVPFADQVTAAQKALDAYRTAVDNARLSSAGLFAEFGTASPALQAVLEDLAAFARLDAAAAVRELSSALADLGQNESLFAGGATGVEKVRELLDVTSGPEGRRATADFLAELQRLDEAVTFEDTIAAAQNLRDQLIAAAGGLENMSAAQREVLQQLGDIIRQGEQFVVENERAVESQEEMKSRMAAVYGLYAQTRDVASQLADETARAAMAQSSLNYGRIQNSEGSGPDAARREVQSRMANPFGRLASGAGGVRPEPRGGGGGGGGGGARIDREALEIEREAARLFDATRTAAEEYAIELANLNRLKAAGAVDAELYDRSLAMLKDRYGEAAQAGQMLADLQQDLASGFADAIIEGRNFGEVMGGILKRLARQLIEVSLAGQDGKGGLLGPLFSAISGAFGGGGRPTTGLFGGGRAGGGPVMAGTPYLVNERTPNSEVFVPSRSGAVLNVAQAQTALRGMGRAGVTVNNHIHIDARGAGAGVGAEIDAALARRLPDIDRRVLETVRGASARGRL